jgi:hypothetical protein
METRRPPRPGIAALAAMGFGLAALALLLIVGATTAPAPSNGAPVATSAGPEVPHALEPPYTLWGLDQRGAPLRWDACAPVTFVLNLDGAPEGAEEDVRRALDLLTQATGLTLTVIGPTDERPRMDRPLVTDEGGRAGWLPVLIAWAPPGEGALPLTIADRGLALPVAVRDGEREALVTGQVVLNAVRADLVAGFEDRRNSLGATLLHELAHVLGLAHVDDPGQLMAADPGTGPVRLGDGDLAGLRAIGTAAGCVSGPAPSAGRGLVPAR